MNLYPLYILDLDGTLFRGDEPTPGAVETVAELRKRGARIRFLTNNSTNTRELYVKKLGRMGFDAKPQEIYSSGIGAATYLLDRGPLFVVGEPGLVATLRGVGLQVGNADEKGVVWPDGEPCQTVVAGLCRTFRYDLLGGAMNQILAGAKFVATNTDATYPVERGKLIPGAGSIVASIQTASGAEPEVIGKPNPFLIELILKESDTPPGDALVVGDRVETDLLAGERAGCPTHLVLTGVAKAAPDNQSYSEDLRGLF